MIGRLGAKGEQEIYKRDLFDLFDSGVSITGGT